MANYGLLDTSIPGQAQNTLMSAFNQTQDRLKAGRLSDLQYQNTERQGKVQDLQLQSAERNAAIDARTDAYLKSPEVQALQQEPDKAKAYEAFLGGIMQIGGFKTAEEAMGYMKSRAETEKPITVSAGSTLVKPTGEPLYTAPPVDKVAPRPAWLKDDGTIDQTIYEGLKGLNPKFSISSGGGTPYSVPVYTPQGVMAFNTRNASLTPLQVEGAPVMRATDDPTLQGRITASKKEGEVFGEKKGNMVGTENALESVGKAKALLKAGIYSGSWGPLGKGIAKWTPGMDKTKASNTETFISEIGNTIVPRLKEFGGNDSNEELRYLKMIQGGDTTFEPAALESILNSVEAKIRRGIDRVNQGLTPDGKPKAPSAPKGAAVPVRSEAEALSLPVGTRYKLPDGRTGTVRPE